MFADKNKKENIRQKKIKAELMAKYEEQRTWGNTIWFFPINMRVA